MENLLSILNLSLSEAVKSELLKRRQNQLLYIMKWDRFQFLLWNNCNTYTYIVFCELLVAFQIVKKKQILHFSFDLHLFIYLVFNKAVCTSNSLISFMKISNLSNCQNLNCYIYFLEQNTTNTWNKMYILTVLWQKISERIHLILRQTELISRHNRPIGLVVNKKTYKKLH